MKPFIERMSEGACNGLDPSLFMPDKDKAATLKAKEICDSCHLESDCLEYALGDLGIKGVWGGTTERERSRIRRQREVGGVIVRSKTEIN